MKKIMNKKEIIREILGEELAEQGYEYVYDDESYVFRKWEGNFYTGNGKRIL